MGPYGVQGSISNSRPWSGCSIKPPYLQSHFHAAPGIRAPLGSTLREQPTGSALGSRNRLTSTPHQYGTSQYRGAHAPVRGVDCPAYPFHAAHHYCFGWILWLRPRTIRNKARNRTKSAVAVCEIRGVDPPNAKTAATIVMTKSTAAQRSMSLRSADRVPQPSAIDLKCYGYDPCPTRIGPS